MLSVNQPLKVETDEDTQEKPPHGHINPDRVRVNRRDLPVFDIWQSKKPGNNPPPSLAPRLVPVIGGHHEVEQQPDGLLHIDLVGGGQPLVELVVDGRQDSLQPRHIDLGIVVQCVEPVVTIGFDHVPDIHQVNCEEEEGAINQSVQQTSSTVSQLPLTVASLLHKPEFAGSPVGRQSDHIQVLSSCGQKA